MTDMTTITHRCGDCGLRFTERAQADTHINETLAASRAAGTIAGSHTIITVKPTHNVDPWAGAIASMFDNMRTLPSGDTVRAYTAGDWS